MEAQENVTLKTTAPVSEYHCLECVAGVRRLRHLTYFTWFRDQLITVPNFPAWVCDMCGRRDYDSRAVSWLKTILNTQRGRKINRRSVSYT